jgi:hypothetical protein
MMLKNILFMSALVICFAFQSSFAKVAFADEKSEKKTESEKKSKSDKADNEEKSKVKDDSESDDDEKAEKPKHHHKRHHDRDDSYKIPYEDLTQEEKEILARGEITSTPYVIGGLLGIWPGFGIGHAVQGRYSEKGWIFTVGELGAITIIAIGIGQSATSCSTYYGTCSTSNNGASAILVGVVGYVGLRIWEIVDVWATPPSFNNRYRDLRNRVNDGREASLSLLVVNMQKDTPGLGLQLRF